jgi:predicted ATPase
MPSEYQLSRIWLKNFKNLLLGGDGLQVGALNVLIGPNGSGKSNLLRVLKFLKEAVISEDVESQAVSAFEQSIHSLGHLRILDGSVHPPGIIHFGFDFKSIDGQPSSIHYDFDLKAQDNHHVFKWGENLKEGGGAHPKNRPPYVYFQQSGSPVGTISFFKDEKKREIQLDNLDTLPSNRLALNAIPELLEEKGLSPDLTPVYKVRRRLIEGMSGWRFYNANDMNLKDIRESEPKIGPADLHVSSSGKNLPIVFHNLYQQYVDFEERINDAMRSVLPGTSKIRAIPSGRLRLTIEWHMEGMGERFYLSDMSDGSVRMLCWAITLLSPEPPTLLVIDEPEVGLHPAWMKTLAEWILSSAEKTQVIVTTHSPDLLDHFTDRPQDIICFTYDGHRHFTPKRLSEAALTSKLEEGWELGDLYRIGDPAIGGWPW